MEIEDSLKNELFAIEVKVTAQDLISAINEHLEDPIFEISDTTRALLESSVALVETYIILMKTHRDREERILTKLEALLTQVKLWKETHEDS